MLASVVDGPASGSRRMAEIKRLIVFGTLTYAAVVVFIALVLI